MKTDQAQTKSCSNANCPPSSFQRKWSSKSSAEPSFRLLLSSHLCLIPIPLDDSASVTCVNLSKSKAGLNVICPSFLTRDVAMKVSPRANSLSSIWRQTLSRVMSWDLWRWWQKLVGEGSECEYMQLPPTYIHTSLRRLELKTHAPIHCLSVNGTDTRTFILDRNSSTLCFGQKFFCIWRRFRTFRTSFLTMVSIHHSRQMC